MAVLAGDVGGTHTRLALVDGEAEKTRILRVQVYPSRSHRSLEELVETFLEAESPAFQAACFGVAGPVRAGTTHATNLPWVVDEEELSGSLGVQASLINDLEAWAWSVETLAPDQVVLLTEGEEDPHGNGALIAPGTGLGEAGLFWDGSRLLPFPSEGGHTEFSPTNEVERGLQLELASRYGHVSWERVVSGPGLVALHRYLDQRGPTRAPPECPLEEAGEVAEGPPAVSRGAREGSCPVCAESLERFCKLLGAKAGDMALTFLATRGIWIGGGIAPDILGFLQKGEFREGFTAKGRMKEVVDRIPVRVILDEHAPLRGAARCALHRSGK